MIGKLLRNYAVYLITAVALVAAAGWIKSVFVKEAILPNLTAIVLALLAINVQTTAVIAVKLREIADREGAGFRSTVTQFRVAIIEQAALVVVSLVLVALSKSPFLTALSGFLDVFSLFVFLGSLHIFVDTTNALLLSMFPKK
jgi:hypothetical protein